MCLIEFCYFYLIVKIVRFIKGEMLHPSMADLFDNFQRKYASQFEITSENGWMKIVSKEPLSNRNYGSDGPFYLEYSIQLDDHRPGVSLEDRSRHVWVRDSEGKGIRHASYSGGNGICHVSIGDEHKEYSELIPQERGTVNNWMKSLDKYVKNIMPDLEEFLENYRPHHVTDHSHPRRTLPSRPRQQ